MGSAHNSPSILRMFRGSGKFTGPRNLVYFTHPGWLAVALLLFFSGVSGVFAQDSQRGAYISSLAGCYSCHTNIEKAGQPYAGGRAIVTAFGTFYSPNITSDPVAGIGNWSDKDFIEAFRKGKRPDGSHYFPVFPYTSYTLMSTRDLLDLKAFLFSLQPSPLNEPAHDIARVLSWPLVPFLWNLLFFKEGPLAAPSERTDWSRGEYIVRGLAHCGECHTPRNMLGAMRNSKFLAGATIDPSGEVAPNITPDLESGLGEWSIEDIVRLLKSGFTPDFDTVQGSMAEVIDHGLTHLTDKDLRSIAVYLKSIAPITSTKP